MKLHPIATVLLAIATRNAVSAKKEGPGLRVGRRRWMANALVQARPNCWRKWILGVGAVCVGVGLSRVLQGTDVTGI
eukprot:scaffold18378_cov78-Skeletonema_marinoi.AAC.1